MGRKMQATARAFVTANPPPDADMSAPPKAGVIKTIEPARPQRAVSDVPPLCKCGARLGRRGKCPALCEPVPAPPPSYKGPTVVGETHTSRMLRSGRLLREGGFRASNGWIGGSND